jgi:hypothetical protein
LKVAITDACIFIDLFLLELSSHFFQLQVEVHTSVDIINELNPEQKHTYFQFIQTGKLNAHNISQEERKHLLTHPFPKWLTMTDKTGLFIATRENAILLSSDKTVRHYAKTIAIEYHGILWILDRLVDECCIGCKDASAKLKKLLNTNSIYQDNIEMLSEMSKRLTKWK